MADLRNKTNATMNHHDEAKIDDAQVKNDVVTAHGDVLADEALGDNITPGYFTSAYFLGTSLVS